jgi:pyruvate carboxylase
VFFELNGQPRTVKVAQKGLESKGRVHLKAEEGNVNHAAAPMPGLVVSVSVTAGQKVEVGDPLVSIEAMKMETVIHAGRSGVVKEIVTPVGTQVEAKDLLVVLTNPE